MRKFSNIGGTISLHVAKKKVHLKRFTCTETSCKTFCVYRSLLVPVSVHDACDVGAYVLPNTITKELLLVLWAVPVLRTCTRVHACTCTCTYSCLVLYTVPVGTSVQYEGETLCAEMERQS